MAITEKLMLFLVLAPLLCSINDNLGTMAQQIVGEDPTVWPPDCFEESDSIGRGDILDPLEILVSDASQLNNISKTVFGDKSRVASLKYCTDSTSKYIESVQVGITNGIGS